MDYIDGPHIITYRVTLDSGTVIQESLGVGCRVGYDEAYRYVCNYWNYNSDNNVEILSIEPTQVAIDDHYRKIEREREERERERERAEIEREIQRENEREEREREREREKERERERERERNTSFYFKDSFGSNSTSSYKDKVNSIFPSSSNSAQTSSNKSDDDDISFDLAMSSILILGGVITFFIVRNDCSLFVAIMKSLFWPFIVLYYIFKYIWIFIAWIISLF